MTRARSERLALLAGFVLTAVVATLLAPGAAVAAAKQTHRVSVSSAGVQGNANSGFNSAPAISAGGRYVAFESLASNLVPGDGNGFEDVFVRDRKLHKTLLVSVSSAGVQGNDISYNPAISSDGRFVGFVSNASNLVSGDGNGAPDVFVRDRKLHKTYLVSVGTNGVPGNGGSDFESISADGRYVSFDSDASNLVAGDSNGYTDVFVRDRKLHRTFLLSVGKAGVQANNISADPSISADGRYVAFVSLASNLGTGDTNGFLDVYVRDRKLGRTTRMSISTAGVQGNSDSYEPAISGAGRYVTFQSDATTLVAGDSNAHTDIFVRDRKLHKTVRVSVGAAGVQGDGSSYAPAISADGRSIAFTSDATNLVSGDANGFSDVFMRDLKLHRTLLVSVGKAGLQGNGGSYSSAVADGRSVAFASDAGNLVTGDSNGFTDVFMRGPFR
jgi:Tol biopolymer transport system component